jgi:hypothetical protein
MSTMQSTDVKRIGALLLVYGANTCISPWAAQHSYLDTTDALSIACAVVILGVCPFCCLLAYTPCFVHKTLGKPHVSLSSRNVFQLVYGMGIFLLT